MPFLFEQESGLITYLTASDPLLATTRDSALAAKRILGLSFVVLAALQCVLVAINTHERKLHGLDLRPLLGTSALLAIAALGLMVSARWAKLLSSALLAAWGVWIAVRDTFVLRLPDPLVGIIFGTLLCLPLIFTLRSQSPKGDRLTCP